MQPFPDLDFVLADGLHQTCNQVNTKSSKPTSPQQDECLSVLDFADFDLDSFQITLPDDVLELQPVCQPTSPTSDLSRTQAADTSNSSTGYHSSPSSLSSTSPEQHSDFKTGFPDVSTTSRPQLEPNVQHESLFDLFSLVSGTESTESDQGSSSYDLSPSPPSSQSSVSSPMQQSTSSASSDESVFDALDALDKKLSMPMYAESKVNESKSSKEPKPDCSYISMIVRAIFSVPEKKMILADIYQYIMDNYPYYNNKERAWRNSIRHNLSLNGCFIKSGRNDGGKGNYWSVHPSCVEDFSNGDYRRRQAKKRVRRAMKTSNGNDVQMSSRWLRTSYHPYATPYNAYSKTSHQIPPNATPAYNWIPGFHKTPTTLTSTGLSNKSMVSGHTFDSKPAISYASDATSFGNLNELLQGNGYANQNSTALQYEPQMTIGSTSTNRPNTISYRPNNVGNWNGVASWQSNNGMNGNAGVLRTTDNMNGLLMFSS